MTIQLRYNVRFFAECMKSKDNEHADALSQCKIARFLQITPGADKLPGTLPSELYPVGNIWLS